ncbi:hypothetical protein EV146_106351 [Mesobacillus foraminis]|uniref:Uncharacterized protein n=1 Tax=Mesobacillus foraminis TaxID=279826 RepID=A0A4R2BDY6_9BACI|nr:hypothetical protein EV146_106351 [Mesobacillus foraminis]
MRGMKTKSRQESKREGLHEGDEDQIDAGKPVERSSWRG